MAQFGHVQKLRIKQPTEGWDNTTYPLYLEYSVDGTTWNVDFWVRLDQLEKGDIQENTEDDSKNADDEPTTDDAPEEAI